MKNDDVGKKTYIYVDCVTFRKTKEAFGGLSNMAAGYPIWVNNVHLLTSEALYQCCRFPHMPDVQRLIIGERSPMTAKMKSKPFRDKSREDWDEVRVKIMRWCLRVKLAQNWDTFGTLLLSTGEKDIVEESNKDPFWGAIPNDKLTLTGTNMLGQLLIELRNRLREYGTLLQAVDPLSISDFVLLECPIPRIVTPPELRDILVAVPDWRSAPPEERPLLARELPAASRTSGQTQIESEQNSTLMNEPFHENRGKRLIEEAFPLKQASLDSVHEKNIRHGHISTLHIWPARRPLAASRAALIAALLPDPGDAKARAEMIRRIGGELVDEGGAVKTSGGVLRWGREDTPDMDYFRTEIKRAYGNRAPKVLDMFAGGGAIPLEAMRLGCDVTAIDYNPVAWFILKCTLEYPSKLVGKRWALPTSSLQHADFEPGLMAIQGKLAVAEVQPSLGEAVAKSDGDLAEHVRYWGKWVLERARADLEKFYPTLPLNPELPVGLDNPLCPTVAYLWARTVPHPDPTKNGLQVPLVKSLWLCKKPGKKRALRLCFNEQENRFDYEVFSPSQDSEVGIGTVSRTGVTCPPTTEGEKGAFFRTEYLQRCGKEGKLGLSCTAVVIDVPRLKGRNTGKEYRNPTPTDLNAAEDAANYLDALAAILPHGIPHEPIDSARPSPNARGASGLTRYGVDTWDKVFTVRQQLALGTFAHWVREARFSILKAYGASEQTLADAVTAYLAIGVDRLADRSSMICRPDPSPTQSGVVNTFSRFALPMTWDFIEGVTIEEASGSFLGALEWVCKVIDHACSAAKSSNVEVQNKSAVDIGEIAKFDAIVTDPPYYDAIPYADLSDFFYVWLRRIVGDIHPAQFGTDLTPKQGELVQHMGRTGGDNAKAKKTYEEGMAQAFRSAYESLAPEGRLVVVFAHKQSDAWETLVGAMIRAGFVVTASWPIDTEMATKVAGIGQARLSSSVWLVSRKRTSNAGKGWYKQVQPKMKERITERLRYFWDEGVRGPDFLWAAIGPGLEAFSAFDEVRRNDGSAFTISEFIKEVRRLTTDFALGQILQGGTEGLDDWTRYALMHAQSFGTGSGSVGEAILLAGAYGLDLNVLTGPKGILTKGKSKTTKNSEDDDDTGDDELSTNNSTDLRLLYWEERKRDDLGEPLESGDWHVIDAIHRLMREWATGDVTRAAIYADRLGLGNNDLFWRVAQALVEMGALQSKERSMLEAIISWGRGRMPQFTYASNATNIPVPQQRPSTLAMDFDKE
jgi:ribA/ribD-fused uncharacterized protein